jgi:thioredoxin reductase
MKEKQIDKLIDNELSSIFPDYAGKKMFSKVFKWNNAFILTDKNYFMADKSRTNMDGLFVCGDSVYAGLDGVAESGELAADGALNYLNNN